MTILIKVIVVCLLFFIFFSLGSALYFLVHDKNQSTRMIKALTWRIVLSIILFMLLIVAFLLGLIQPHPIMGWR